MIYWCTQPEHMPHMFNVQHILANSWWSVPSDSFLSLTWHLS